MGMDTGAAYDANHHEVIVDGELPAAYPPARDAGDDEQEGQEGEHRRRNDNQGPVILSVIVRVGHSDLKSLPGKMQILLVVLPSAHGKGLVR